MSVLSERVYLMEQKQRYKEREHEQRKKELERIEKKKQQKAERKQYEKDLLVSCKMELKEKFEEEFRLQGLKAKYHFYKIENRDVLIQNIGKSVLETDYLETNYNKILNEIIKKYELNKEYQEERNKEIAQEYAEKMQPIWEAERKKKERKENINAILKLLWTILKWIFIILFGGIYLLFKLIYALACK